MTQYEIPTESKKKNPFFIIYIFGLLGMSALLYIIALSDLDIVYWEARKKDMTYALSNAFGFGGHNVSVIFKKYQ